MKKLFTISIYLAIVLISSNANAQLVTITETHQMPVIGDSIHYVDANSFGFDPTGTGPVTNKVWDESAIFLTGTTYDFVYVDPTTVPSSLGKDSFPTATLARSESGAPGYFYYQNTANDINRVGWFNNTTSYGIYTNGTIATEFHFPIAAGQTVTSNYNGHFAPFNVGEDSVRIENGTLSINADMQGQLILPTGTFNNVLRLHVLESFHIKTYYIGLTIQDDLVADDYYYWFSDSVLQPILVSGVTAINGTAQTPVLRYQPISIPTGIASTVNNIITISPNPSTETFAIKNADTFSANYSLEIYNMLGEKINYTENIHQTSREINISNSAKGIYFVKMFADQKIQTAKIVIH